MLYDVTIKWNSETIKATNIFLPIYVKKLTKRRVTMDQKTISQDILLRMVKSFVKNEVAPYDMEIDHTRSYVNNLWSKVKDNDFLSLMLPQEYGGAGFDGRTTAKVINEIAKGNASLASNFRRTF
jgi:Acyl-CoA dehydrogenases